MIEEDMMRAVYTYERVKACPVEATFQIIGKSWTILLVRELLIGKKGFNQLMKAVDGINSRMLSLRLKELENYKLVRKKILAQTPIRVEYSLTEKGRGLIPILFAAMKFSSVYFPENVFADKKSRTPEEIYAEVSRNRKRLAPGLLC